MKGISYVQKIAIPYLFLLALTLFGIAFATSSFFDQFVLANWEKELTAEASLIAEQLSGKLSISDPAHDIPSLVDKYSEITGDRVTLILSNGNVIAESDIDPTTMENHLLRPEVQAALTGNIQPTIRLSTTMHQRYIYVAFPIYEAGNVVGIIRLAKSLNFVR